MSRPASGAARFWRANTFWRANAPLLAAAAVAQAAYLAMWRLGDLAADIPLTWAAFYSAFAAYAAVSWRILRHPAGSIWVILGAALLFRLALLTTAPSLSDDVYRYVWDGRVQWAGINPYRFPPEAAELAHLRLDLAGVYEGINHRHIPTIYPPVAQLFFLAVTGVSAHPTAVKVGLVLCEAALVAALWGLLRQRGLDPRRLVLYAWNPLAVVEVAGSGHVDPLALALLCGALYWLCGGACRAAGAALAAAFLAKLLPAVALPLLWRECGRRLSARRETARRERDRRGWPPPWRHLRPALRPVVWFGAVAAAGYGLYASAGTGLFSGLQTYALRWRFNDAAYSLVHGVLRAVGGLPDADALYAARWGCAAAFLAVAARILWRCADPVRATFALLAAHLLLAPTLHPWYVLWVLPFLPLFPNPAWVSFSGLVFFAYWVLDGYRSAGLWQESAWVKWAEYAPFYALLALTWWRRRRQGI